MNRPATPRTLPLQRLAAALSIALLSVDASSAPDVATPRGGPTVVVQNCNDSGSGSLREAYEENPAQGTIIDLSQLACSTITLAGELNSGAGTVLITLQGPADRSLTIDGNGVGRVIHHGGNLYLRDLVITHGYAHDSIGGGCIATGSVGLDHTTVTGCEVRTSGVTDAHGGAIRASANVFVIASQVTDNTAHAASADSEGGGIWGQSIHVSAQSTISGNTASGDGSHYARGGGVFSLRTTEVSSSTLSDNQADSGGGLFTTNASTDASQFTNSTISNNDANGGAGGGIFNGQGSITMSNCTITGNQSTFDFGAGLYLSGGNADLRSTIIANNTAGYGLNIADVGGHAGAVISGNHNIVTVSTLALPPDTFQQDPLLDSLQDNGGGVFTHALLPGSPALDTGQMSVTLTFDQRGAGYPRVSGSEVDIGAFERQIFVDLIFSNGFEAPLRGALRDP